MMLAIALADVPFGDRDAWRNFLFEHAEEHKQFAAAILAQKGKQIETVVFSDEGDIQNWLSENNNAHSEEMQALGIESVNIADVDLSDQGAYNDWMAEHAMLHQMTQQALGL